MLDIRVPVRALRCVGGRWKATFLHINSSSEKPQWNFETEIRASNLAWSRLQGCGGGKAAIVTSFWLKSAPQDATTCQNMQLFVDMILCWRLIKVEVLYITRALTHNECNTSLCKTCAISGPLQRVTAKLGPFFNFTLSFTFLSLTLTDVQV